MRRKYKKLLTYAEGLLTEEEKNILEMRRLAEDLKVSDDEEGKGVRARNQKEKGVRARN